MTMAAESYDFQKANLQRCKSSVDLLQNATAILPNRLRPSLGLYNLPLQRWASSPDLSASYNHGGQYLSQKYWPSKGYTGLVRYRPVYNYFDDYVWDRRNATSELNWPPAHWPDKRYHYYVDKHLGLWSYYPALEHWPKYEREATFTFRPTLSVGWFKHRDPAFDTPFSNHYVYRPWNLIRSDHKLSASLYRGKIINYDQVERNWLAPHRFNRWLETNASKPFVSSTWQTSPRRYAYSFL
uniref:Uncharacterized protein n=1 Tax=Romanomermis culicivorax TaxID=13658 RepID=A0A915KRP2_ROMCU